MGSSVSLSTWPWLGSQHGSSHSVWGDGCSSQWHRLPDSEPSSTDEREKPPKGKGPKAASDSDSEEEEEEEESSSESSESESEGESESDTDSRIKQKVGEAQLAEAANTARYLQKPPAQ